MKKHSRILALALASTLSLTMVACNNQKTAEFKSHTKELGAETFLNTDWGMNLEQTLKSLGLKKDDIEPYEYDLGESFQRVKKYKIKDKMKINGVKGTVILLFRDTISDVVPPNISQDTSSVPLGLTNVKILFNEDDKQKVYKAFDKELGAKQNRQNIKEEYLREGILSTKVRVKEMSNLGLKKDFVDVYTAKSDLIKPKDCEDMDLYSVSVCDSLIYKGEEKGIKQIVEYDGTGIAMINNLDR